MTEPQSKPRAVLFACGMNSVRSPMAAALLKQMLGTSLYVEQVVPGKAHFAAGHFIGKLAVAPGQGGGVMRVRNGGIERA